jgi:hypothetical protein
MGDARRTNAEYRGERHQFKLNTIWREKGLNFLAVTSDFGYRPVSHTAEG